MPEPAVRSSATGDARDQRVEVLFADLRRRLDALDPTLRGQIPNRSVLARCAEMELAYRSEIRAGALAPAHRCGVDERADVVLELSAADAKALLDGELDVRAAWRDGRLRVRAAPLDLLRLRALR